MTEAGAGSTAARLLVTMNAKAYLIIAAAAVVSLSQSPAQQRGKSVPPELEARLKEFFVQKEDQAHALAKEENSEQAPEVWAFFKAGKEGDWKNVGSIYRTLRSGAYQYEGTRTDKRLVTMAWQPVNEAYGAYEGFSQGAEDYVVMFGREILDSLPRGSIYFGGTDPGRWLVTAFSKSHANADPCFVLTQNALADGLYLKYLRTMYGRRIVTPSDSDSQKAFADYVADAEKRLKEGTLKPGENATILNGKTQVSGQVAVMEINARIARIIFDANPKQEFFIEESFPLDWMYPYLSPNGLIMKINRKPPAELASEVLRKDREYWTRFVDRALGQWLTPGTSIKDVCDFVTTVFERKEDADYQADEKFVRNAYVCKTYSKLRSSIAGVYAWRWKNSKTPEEKQRMAKETDLAFRQAYALCPYSPEAVYRYTSWLTEQARTKDALLLAQTAARLDPRNSKFAKLVEDLEDK